MSYWKAPRALLAAALLHLQHLRRHLPHPLHRPPRPAHPQPHPLLHLLLPRLQEARTARAVAELLAVAAHFPLEATDREQVRAAAMLALARSPSGSASPKSSRSRRKTARSTRTPLRRR